MLAWALFGVLTVVAVAGLVLAGSAGVPTATFADGEATRVILDPADRPAIFAVVDGSASVEYEVLREGSGRTTFGMRVGGLQ